MCAYRNVYAYKEVVCGTTHFFGLYVITMYCHRPTVVIIRTI